MNRRNFLKTVGVIAGCFAANPAFTIKALVKPKTIKAIIQNPACANGLLSPAMIAREALRMLQDNIVMRSLVSKNYENDFNVGDRITIRRPVKFQRH